MNGEIPVCRWALFLFFIRMTLTPQEFLQKYIEKDPNSLDGMVAQSLTTWVEEYGEDGFERFVDSLQDEINATHSLHKEFLREWNGEE